MWPGGEKQGEQAKREREEERDAEVAVSIYYCIKESNPLIPLPAGHCESKKQKLREMRTDRDIKHIIAQMINRHQK